MKASANGFAALVEADGNGFCSTPALAEYRAREREGIEN